MHIYQLNWGELTPESFLKDYWQKKPLIIKNAFTAFEDPIEPDELAGLAMEDDIESRIVGQNQDKSWFVKHGPFDDFSQFGEEYWTLLVQATNHWSEQTHALLSPFRFIPSWRLDDVMVSFSTPHGGVGPHLDRYDVFIIQGMGKRHWRVGLPDSSLATRIPHEDLKQVSDFEAVIDVITEPGDLLYIPPNHPHDGIAIENSLNFSVGFQAPSQQELLTSFADHMIDNEFGEQRLIDAGRTVTEIPEQITGQDLALMKQFMVDGISDEHGFHDFLCRQITSCHHSLDILVPDDLFTPESLQKDIQKAEAIAPVLGLKSTFSQDNNTLYVNGEGFTIEQSQKSLAVALAKNQVLTIDDLKSSMNCLKNEQLLTSLLNMGVWYLV